MNFLIPATSRWGCSEAIGQTWEFYWQGVGFMLTGAALWWSGRAMGCGVRWVAELATAIVVVIAVLAALTWGLSTLEFTVPDQGPRCPGGRPVEVWVAVALLALGPFLAILIAAATVSARRLPFWARLVVGGAGVVALAVLLGAVLEPTR
ncbi:MULTISPECIES: hypothetical protein [unclassified Agromyces]|uniref:hypothetical protein n=1 Tax=unclassified Agromyces TaxID=2639701 RepID=UPI0030142D0E